MGVSRRLCRGSALGVQLGGFFAAIALAAGCAGRASDSGKQGSGSAGATAGGSVASAGVGNEGGSAASETCGPGRAPLRRLTRAEYISSLTALFGDVAITTAEFPEEWRSFPIGNWAEGQQIGLEQATTYSRIAKQLATRATRDPQALAVLAACAAQSKPDTACARTTIESFASKAFRRAPTEEESSELLSLHATVSSSGADFAEAMAAVVAAVLQAPEFLYRIERGTDEGPRPDVRRLTGDEMASRLSYLFWGSPPDEALRAAAQSGVLLAPDGIAREAARLLDDPRSHAGLAAFFDDYLELYRLPALKRSAPDFSPELAESLGQATQRFLEAQIFEKYSSWPSVLTADTAFVNERVSSLFGVTGITGSEWQEVALDPTERLGLLTQPSVLIMGLVSDRTNPTQRGYRMMEKVLCRHVPREPPEIMTVVSETPPGVLTTRQRWTLAHSGPDCVQCHRDMDQLGFALENFDAVGRYRSQEDGVAIDTKVDITGVGATNGPVELVTRLASLPETQACFAKRFAEFGLGKSLATDPAGACLTQDIARRFAAAGHDVRHLLLELTQTDAFLYLPKDP
jgi:uncharacterized protein DUF1592/uncharacterized protein DUF1588/uncharacterized protein DUF1595/uncharacterized protein DUF1585/uncharacterized protein DUF1587